ncbi:hypothetical protein BJY00DRAFT_314815 [Aspergillus carlsbadensis]|nr:hypothetical protein BJY00DRAFT_314815 [Aspergillus carlsbadensis]
MAHVHSRLVDSAQRLVDAMDSLSVSATNPLGSDRVALVKAIWSMEEAVTLAGQQARLVEARMIGTHAPGGEDIAQLSCLRRQAKTLAKTTQALGDAVERYFVSYVTSLARSGEMVQTLLSHFDDQIMGIAREVLDSTSDESHAAREILERCYDQALDHSGALHVDNYFVPLGEASLGRPYDADFESEAYYQHQERLYSDEGYAKAHLARYEREAEQERRQKEEWIGFWVQALSRCPDGPTLFYPPASRQPQCKLKMVPRYLFRTFDHAISGRNDGDIIASSESISSRSDYAKIDLLARPEEEAARMLERHLRKPCFDDDNSADNLVSWSSSLLFVIQYAIWRRRCRGSSPAEVKICMVDTTQFPRGQFARDTALIEPYRENIRAEIFEFRLEAKDYDNGEYLSQGILHHAGRSSVVSLAQLIEAGLHDLYPEFSDRDAKGKWTNRVKELRAIWSVEHISSTLEIQRALEIARTCFPIFNATDVALLLLSFKPRKLQESAEISQSSFDKYGPREVQRYMKIAASMFPRRGRASEDLTGSCVLDNQLLKNVFECAGPSTVYSW